MRPPLSLLALLALFATLPTARAQVEGLLIPEDDVHRFLDRQRVLGHLPGADLGAKPLSVARAAALLDRVAARDSLLAPIDRRRLAELRGERVGGLFGPALAARTALYRAPRAFASVSGVQGSTPYGFEVAPLAYLDGGPARETAGDQAVGSTFRLTRGARVAGHVGRVFFDARATENQTQIPLGRVQRPEVTAPRLGFAVYPEGDVPSYDYTVSSGVVGYQGEVFEARFGRDRNTWGFGHESIVLSDYATVYDQLQLRWDVWRLGFQSLYARFNDPRTPPESDGLLPNRYAAMHRLAVDLGWGLEVEAFETIVFAADTTDRRRRTGFELGYLSPVQFYRATERDLGSPDNAMLGVGAAWQAVPGLRVYGQGLLDELTASRFFDDYWGNKWAFITGLEVSDPGLPGLGRLRGLDLQLEYARLRPYIYSHRDRATGFVHSGDALGHPAGPNASDLSLSALYRPAAHVELALDAAYTVRGRNTDSLNFGSDPARPFGDRVSNDDVPTLQGVRQTEWLAEGRAGLRLLPDLTAGAAVRLRSVDDALDGRRRYVAPVVYLRWGLPFASDRW